jgi:hypothetical protein
MFVAYKEIEVPIAGSATPLTALNISDIIQEIAEMRNGRGIQVLVTALLTDIVAKFGNDNTVAADATVNASSFRRPVGNFTVRNGAVMGYDVPEGTTHFSAIPRDEATAGILVLTFGYGEI